MHKNKVILIEQAAAGLAHELRNPLTSIVGLAEILREKLNDNEEINEILDIVNSEAEQLYGVVNTLLKIAHSTPPRLLLARIDFLIYEVITGLKADDELNGNRDIRYTVYKDDDFPDWVFIDYLQIKEAISSIAVNAVQSIQGRGGVAFYMYYFPSEGNIKVEIIDTGCGISPDNLPRVGIPFYTTKPSGRGLGLSLSIMRVDRHGGRIEVDSELNKGTTVSVYLPV